MSYSSAWYRGQIEPRDPAEDVESGGWDQQDPDAYPPCPACGEPIDYCLGHGEIADPESAALVAECFAEYHGAGR